MKKLVIAVVVIWVLVVAGAVGVGIALFAGDDSDDGEAGEETSETAGPTDSPSLSPGEAPEGLEEFYGQTIEWGECGPNECGTLTVPVDYDEPDGDTVEIALERAPATGERLGSLVVNPGGPGAPGTDVAEQASAYFADELRQRYDIVGFDPRGTGESEPVDCLSDEELDEYVASDPDPDDAEEAEELEDTLQEFWDGCAENSSEVVDDVSTIEAARDMDVLRAALGEKELRYFGFSYGTRLGATYAELFPQNVGRFVLDAAVDPSLSTREGSLSQAAGFETALRSYLQNCVDGGDCFLGDTVDEGLRTIQDLLAEIERDPLPTNQERDLEIGNAFYGLVFPLYAEETWTYLDQGLQQALDGDGSTLLLLSDIYGSRDEDGDYTDNSLEAITVVNCLDDPYAISPDEVPEQYDDFEKASPTFGRVFAWGLVACHGMPFESDEPEIDIRAEGAAPIVVVGTTRDPATPYEEAVAMAEQLESGILLSREGDGHAAYNRGNACIDDTIHAYLIDGDVPRDGIRC